MTAGAAGAYAAESQALDAEILGVIAGWEGGEPFGDARFNDLALRLLDYQLRYNAPYARYCAAFGVAPGALPNTWEAIPAVPAAAFKEAALATFDPARAALAFSTSGTTAGRRGRHYFETPALYDAAALAAFDRFVLTDGARLQYVNLVPDPSERPDSSLGYMMQAVARARGAAATGWYLRGDALEYDRFVAVVRSAIACARPVCIATTAFALAHALDRMERDGLTLPLPPHSRVMETGGFKGRMRAIERGELYARLCERFALAPDAIVAEYGMTELSSQYYDDVATRTGSFSARRKAGPPWLRARVVGPNAATLPAGVAGTLVHVDLANRGSCIAIATDDLGVRFGADGDGFVLLGRERGAALRGCSLDAETLR